jgi:hypothetical protein
MRSRYRILQALTTEELERLVNKLVEVGFIPVGGPFYAPGSGFWLMQAVFDPAPTEREAESSTPAEGGPSPSSPPLPVSPSDPLREWDLFESADGMEASGPALKFKEEVRVREVLPGQEGDLASDLEYQTNRADGLQEELLGEVKAREAAEARLRETQEQLDLADTLVGEYAKVLTLHGIPLPPAPTKENHP